MSRREAALSARWRLTLSITAVAAAAAIALWAVAMLFALRYVPEGILIRDGTGGWAPGRREILDAFIPRATAAGIGVVALSFVGAWFFAGRLLRPLDALTRTARAVADGSLSSRADLTGPRDEFREVGDALDLMLDRIESTVARERRFIANASHELRTPIATTRALVDLAAADPNAELPAIVREIGIVTDRANAAVEALLTLSRVQGVALVRESVDLSLVLETALEDTLMAAEARHAIVHARADEAWVSADAALLERVATNLLMNAVLHGDGDPLVITASTIATETGGLLTVESTGLPLDENAVASFTEAFHRGERTGASGAGLGLALVDSIVTAHEGTLMLAPRVGGGLVVTVALPRTSA